jgi:hypothetical protein
MFVKLANTAYEYTEPNLRKLNAREKAVFQQNFKSERYGPNRLQTKRLQTF